MAASLRKKFVAFFLRTLLGLIFLMQGFGKVFRWGIEEVYSSTFTPLADSFLPFWLVKGTAYYTSYVELLGGILLVLGLFRTPALIGLGSVLLIVAYGHGLMQPIWELQHVAFRSLLLAGVLLLPDEWDKWSLDHLRSEQA
ncbi:MAG: DoxX family membrane protein [Saprospiraceae bacterium]|nr:DoxX family membrane protein [Saprospiraceae bacterium]